MSGSGQFSKGSSGRALVVGSGGSHASIVQVLERLGYETADADDPYTAMAELCRRPLAYRAMVLSLSGIYREELQMIPAVKRRFTHMEIWLAQTDGKAAALAEGTRLGADGILSDEGVHRFTPARAEQDEIAPPEIAAPAATAPAVKPPRLAPPLAGGSPGSSQLPRKDKFTFDAPSGEAILTADELRALLQDPPTRPAANDE